MTIFLMIDAGVAFKLIAPNPQQSFYIDLVDGWERAGYRLCAPTLWAYQLTSAISKMVHFGHLTAEEGRASLRLAHRLRIELIIPNEEQASRALAWSEKLSRAAAYDSFYLALAETLECELWTVDKRLVNAAARPWVKLVDEPD